MAYRAWRPDIPGQPVRASLGTPRWIPDAKSWPRCWEITPRPAYLDASAETFEREYVAQLDRYGARRIAERFAEITHQTGAELLIVCCFEGPREQCHRATWAAWWLQTTGEDVPEYDLSPTGER
jgi:hypothetical protein